MFLGNTLIAWKTKKQQVASHSFAESEYMAMKFGSQEVIWLFNLLAELQAPQGGTIPYYCESTAAIYISNNPVFHERTKHIERDYIRYVTRLRHVTSRCFMSVPIIKLLTSSLNLCSLLNFISLVGKLALKTMCLPS